ncbi:MAG: PilX N-terminal domain-containing pilus assembly protein [Thermoanaerobaculia bacterium]
MKPSETVATTHRTDRRGEGGSAYVAVLVVLVVLTIFGLALALITQTEMQVGSNEKTINRVFYVADSGIEIATARVLVSRDHRARIYTMTDNGGVMTEGKVQLGTRVDVSPFYPIFDAPCNLCEINNAGAYNERAFRKIIHAVTVDAARFARLEDGSNETPVAQKTLSAMIEIQPWQASPEAYAAVNDPAELARIRY